MSVKKLRPVSAEKKHLAQANIAWMRFPLDDARMDGFRENLTRVNAAAEGAPGFVWRFQTDAGDATDLVVLDDPEVLFNMSVWKSRESLLAYTYREIHGSFFRRRSEWFERTDRDTFVLWWVEAGHIPTPDEAMERFDLLWRDGPTSSAFTLRIFYNPDGTPGEP